MPIDYLPPMSNRLPTGAGSRGGTIHLPGELARYNKAWKASHPAYRAREALRMSRRRGDERALAHGLCPADTAAPADLVPRPLLAAETCRCPCPCAEAVVVVCGFCRDGLHRAA